MARIDAQTAGGTNLLAFLDTIGFSEGVYIPGSDEGYNVIVGDSLFHDYKTHPAIWVKLPNLGITSSAAGKYQIMYRNACYYSQSLHLPDFSPISQDKIALQLIKECGAVSDIQAGLFKSAIIKCNSRWASFPGAGYGQRENKMELLLTYFIAAGGRINGYQL